MKRTIRLGLCIALACSLAGCSGNYAKHEALYTDMLKALNDLADALESVKDRESAKAAAPKINEVCDRMSELGKRAEATPKVTKSEDDKLKEKFEPQFKKANERLQKVAFQAGANSGGDPDFEKSIKKLEGVGKDLEKLGGK
jgi:hypothetical protein